MRVAVIGAGVAGLNAGRQLEAAGMDVVLFEKARGASGRLSTRRSDFGAFDHGAQYFTARDEEFRNQVEAWLADGVVERWAGRIVRLSGGGESTEGSPVERYVGCPGMSAVARDLRGDLNISLGVRIESVKRVGERWTLTAHDGSEFPGFDLLVMAVPAPQAVPFLSSVPEFDREVRLVNMAPCHAVMVRFKESYDPEFDAAFVDSDTLSWVARNSSKPGRGPEACWVLHSTVEWSASNLDADASDVTRSLLLAFQEAVGSALPPTDFSAMHRWLLSRALDPLRSGPLWDSEQSLGVCGDWTLGDRVEDGYMSASRLVRRILDDKGAS